MPIARRHHSDPVALPAATLALVLGIVGIRRFRANPAAGVVAAACGTILGAATSFLTVIVLAATHFTP